ncbi:achaete-scute homolog 2-like [Dendronephthya gigantea]|uniref:achaete-scute homolog 2-like n=1 Tax=Dendronephthya gigantea TaxID=151771 RepID=UPI00106B5375|nr:achaete-scute homolog 2-like [Dendronephthya gigantea]
MYQMPEPNFCIDRGLGMLTLKHYEHGVDSDSSTCGESGYSNSELSSDDSSPPYIVDKTVNTTSFPGEIKPLINQDSFSESKAEKVLGNGADREEDWHEKTACRYRRGKRGKGTISKRNERERKRVRLISDGFYELRKHLMIEPCNRKLPKLQILRKAIWYIKNLQDMIKESDLQNAAKVGQSYAMCSPKLSRAQVPFVYNSHQRQNIPSTCMNTSTFPRQNVHQMEPQVENPWLQGYQF